MGLEQDGEGRGTRGGVSGDQIVAARADCLASELARDVAELVFEKRRDARLIHDLGSKIGAAHRIHRRTTDEFGEQLRKREHPPIIAIPLSAVNRRPYNTPTDSSTGTAHEDSRIPGQGPARRRRAPTSPRHIVVTTPDEAATAFDQLGGGGGVVVKAQVHAGGRGAGQLKGYPDKLGGVKFVTDAREGQGRRRGDAQAPARDQADRPGRAEDSTS